MVGREYLHYGAFLLSNLLTCQGKQVTGITNVKATCHQLWHTTFSLSGLYEKTTVEGSTCALDSSVVLHGHTPCDRTVSQSRRSTECPLFSGKKNAKQEQWTRRDYEK